jgi:protein involved in polysaccharide export with SLBB domain
MLQTLKATTRWPCLWALFSIFLLAGCASFENSPSQQDVKAAAAPAPESDILRVGDEVMIEFRGVPNPPDKHTERIKEDGTIRPPVIGEPVQAANLTRLQLEQDLQKRYDKLYKHMTVTVHTENRVFYVDGEVRNPSRQSYTGEMTVTRAIASAGGFTDFAKKTQVQLIRANGQKLTVNCVEALRRPELDKPVLPDDRVHVPRRFY